MILILHQHVTHKEAERLIQRLAVMGLKAVKETQQERIAIAIVSGIDASISVDDFVHLPQVERVANFSQQFKLAGHDLRQQPFTIQLGDCTIGGRELTVMGGPCSVENSEQIHKIAAAVADAGAKFLRGGAFKPRTSPYDFQGLGEQGLEYLRLAARQHNLLTVSEVMDLPQLEVAADKIDILQIGARNMQNFTLLKALGKVPNPILLKRGMSATYREFLLAAEYILNAGNPQVILCERGIRTFENYTRNTLDLAAVPVLQHLSHLPVIVDPSHATGLRHLIAPMARAAVAAGADGVIIETHCDPDNSYSDAQQAITLAHFADIVADLHRVREALQPMPLQEQKAISA